TVKDGDVAGAGQIVATSNGRVEMLLTPGVFLRIGERSSVKMISAGLIDTRVEVLRGEAMIEATDLQKENRVRVLENRASADLMKTGLDRFDADRSTIAVLDGKANVMENDQQIEVKGGREVNLNSPLRSEKFDKKAEERSDPLYQWSKARSGYLARAAA